MKKIPYPNYKKERQHFVRHTLSRLVAVKKKRTPVGAGIDHTADHIR